MTCAHCVDAGGVFRGPLVRRELQRYRRRGPRKTTRLLLDALRERLPEPGFTVLDVGGGVGVLQHELLEEGAGRVVSVDAAPAYLEAARSEAERRGTGDRLDQRLGDFVELAADVGEVDVVTLDRVVCCYPDMPALVGSTSERARRLYGVVLPREVWWVRAGVALINLVQRLRRSSFRVFVHPTPTVLAEIEGRGLRRAYRRTTLLWDVMLFEKRSPPTAP